MNYNISQLLHYTTREITDIVDLGKVRLPSNSPGLHPWPLFGQLNIPMVYNVGFCPCMSTITTTLTAFTSCNVMVDSRYYSYCLSIVKTDYQIACKRIYTHNYI